MPLPDAKPGLVFRYEYVWKRQALAGKDIAEKERPACVVLSVDGVAGNRRVLIVPITTQAPGADTPALEVQLPVKRHLGLDADRSSWIILSEANIDAWPSPDMRPIPGIPGRVEYGLLPLRMVTALREAVLTALTEKRLAYVDREKGP
ncbi:type II toxin-antitoxin system PemK/MazF family toxin [Nitrospirillum pindoramense]|uniref:PemK-like, MazF-like toxin of type II toxin-antitoxin system n=1 Tax=Nitrospirillum amazonense TaxID=28077 RepID=A0A560GT33_9PROT|nr:type II toxin-antitoxin system PemK/MazF family toxin [Nitrospirillum amazonense]TWB37203.1 PemK-like, MazF-like toxin of type II toxin-antitoxin system [Nitrospirillum amazonense]